MKWKMQVLETHSILYEYIVEADTVEEAEDAACCGDHISSKQIGEPEISDRSIESDLEEC